ncbi:hypothetical protein GGI42DRAFT_215071 [Trichoderma sp. SZMC 28013]
MCMLYLLPAIFCLSLSLQLLPSTGLRVQPESQNDSVQRLPFSTAAPQSQPELIVPATSPVPADGNILLLFSNCPPVRPDLVFSSPSLHLETILHGRWCSLNTSGNSYVSIFLPNFNSSTPLTTVCVALPSPLCGPPRHHQSDGQIPRSRHL